MNDVAQGHAPTESSRRQGEYLLKKLEEARKECQWLLGLAAAGVLGVVIKDNFGAHTPNLRLATLIISSLQILISMVGGMSWFGEFIDPAQRNDFLIGRLKQRYILRNVAVSLLAVSFIFIAVMGWNGS